VTATTTASATRTVTVLARIEDGRADEVRALLHRFRPEASPFRILPDIHFARLLVVQRLVHQQRPLLLRRGARLLDLVTHGSRREQQPDPSPHPYLLATFTIDQPAGPDEVWFDRLRERLGHRADAIWGHCVDYPGHRDRAAFLRFFRDRSLAAGYAFTRAADCTVAEATRALRLRRELADLAVVTQDLPADQVPPRLRPVLARRQPTPSRWPGAGGWATLAEPAPAGLELADIQGLVLTGYGFHQAATHLFLRIAAPVAARRWLAAAADRVTSVAAAGRRPGRALHVALTHTGLGRLGVPQRQLAAFPAPFRQGMWERETLLTGGGGTQTWQPPFDRAGAVHVLLLLSAADRTELDSWVGEIRRELAGNGGFEILAAQQGDRIRQDGTGSGHFVEHFGFADGLSRPGVDGYDGGTSGDSLPPGEFVLGHRDFDRDIAGRGLPVALAHNGSYLVYRKLEQDVAAFRAVCAGVAHRFPGGGPEAAAKLIGRWQSGRPLLGPAGQLSTEDSSFGYAADPDGLACPIGAHVRRANPRDSLPGGPELTRRHQMLRRGIPYGPYAPAGSAPDGSAERGLLFLAVVGDLGRQFEFVQVEWMSDGNAFGLGADADVLATAGGSRAKVAIQGSPPTFVPVPRPVVTCRGGDYFLLPGIGALRSLDPH
jgi:Dyp-type peroxidase family